MRADEFSSALGSLKNCFVQMMSISGFLWSNLYAMVFVVYTCEMQQFPAQISGSKCELANFKNHSLKFHLIGSSSQMSWPTEYVGDRKAHQDEGSEPPAFNVSPEIRDSILYLVFVSKSHLGLLPMKERKCIALWIGEAQGEQIDCEIFLAVKNVTSTTAKNLLYAEALKLGLNGIQYLVMVDGSSRLIQLKDYGQSVEDPWSTFERYLLEWEPAVGVPHSLGSDYDEAKEVQEIFNFDQAVVAFHIEAAPLLLPFWKFDDDDGTSRYSGAAQATIAHAAFQHHVIQFNSIRVLQAGVPSESATPKPLKEYVMWGANA